MKAAGAAVRLLGRAIDWLSALLLLAVLIVATAQVTARYVLNVPMPWGEELTRLLFIWLVLMAAARTAHLRIDLVPKAVGPRARLALEWFSGLLGIGMLVLLAWYGQALVELTANDRFTALGVSVQYLYWSLIVGAVLWIIVSFARLLATGSSVGDEEAPPA